MKLTAAVITISDKGSVGEREDTSGPAISERMIKAGWEIVYRNIIPDDRDTIKSELIKCADELRVPLVLTTGGTGFSPRDITPEATLEIVERAVPGIPEAMRAESLKITPRGMLSRAAAGIRGGTLIINLPGSKKAATECLEAVVGALDHAAEMLLAAASSQHARVVAVCVSERKGEQKHEMESVYLRPDHGIEGDAHAANWHRQVSLLAVESVEKVQQAVSFTLEHGAFAENILTAGIVLYELPVGTRLQIGEVLAEVTQIGKECHTACAIREAAGDCVMPREGIFVKVLTPGTVRAGDELSVLRG